MTAVDLPIFMVALRDQWISVAGLPAGSNVAFGNEEDARRFAASCAEAEGISPALFRIVEYRFSGRVVEG
jgi:hypothetical protein